MNIVFPYIVEHVQPIVTVLWLEHMTPRSYVGNMTPICVCQQGLYTSYEMSFLNILFPRCSQFTPIFISRDSSYGSDFLIMIMYGSNLWYIWFRNNCHEPYCHSVFLGVQPVTVIRCERSSWYLLHIIGLSTFNQFAAITLAKRRHLYCTPFVHIRLNKMWMFWKLSARKVINFMRLCSLVFFIYRSVRAGMTVAAHC